jgi:Zn-dependent protease with chaperone function
MPFELRLIVVSLAAFAWAGVAGTLLAAWLWQRPCTRHAADRAARLLRLRLLPLVFGSSAMVLAVISFLRFEPRDIDESPGWVIRLLAGAGLLLLASAGWRAIQIALATRRAWLIWRETASPVEPGALDDLGIPAFAVTSAFPVVAVLGFWRPRLVIARSVLDACTRGELHAILQHERHHLQRRDNLRRAVLAIAPDPLALLPASRQWLRAWHEATEEAADDFARRASDAGGVMLAQALVKVARLTPPGSFAVGLPASALYGGEHLEQRVRRLLQPIGDRPRQGRQALSFGAIAAAAFSGSVLALESLHDLVEVAVNSLP